MSTASFRLGIAAEGIYQPLGPAETLARFARLGTPCVQLEPWLLPERLATTPDQARAFAASLAQYGLAGESFSWWPGDCDAERYAAGLRRILGLAEPLGYKLLNVYHYPFKAEARATGRSDLDVWRGRMRDLLDLAARAGVTVTLEPEAHDRSGTARGCLELLAAAEGHPALAVNYDPCNLYHGGDEAFPRAYQLLKPHIRYVHLKNGYLARPGETARGLEHPEPLPNGDRLIYTLLDRGAVNVAGVLDQLARDGYAGLVVLEPHLGGLRERLEALAYEMELVRALLARTPERKDP